MAKPSTNPVPEWGGDRAQAALRRVRADGARHNKPCCLCDQPIDYTLRYPHPMSCTVQHVKARSLHPELTWDPTNWSPCHARCNSAAGNGQPKRAAAGDLDRGLGIRSPW